MSLYDITSIRSMQTERKNRGAKYPTVIFDSDKKSRNREIYDISYRHNTGEKNKGGKMSCKKISFKDIAREARETNQRV